MNLVTIMLPNFNGEKYIERAIESIKAQTMPNFVCNIVDDASTDNSVSIILNAIKNDKRFNLIRLGENKKIANARNTAAKLATTPYLAALDSDDEWLPNHLSLRLDYILKTDYDYLYGEMKVIGDPYVVDKNNPERLAHVTEFSQGATIFIKTDVFWKIGGYKHLYGEDGDFWERAINMGFKLKRVDFATYLYYRNPGSITDLMAKGIFK